MFYPEVNLVNFFKKYSSEYNFNFIYIPKNPIIIKLNSLNTGLFINHPATDPLIAIINEQADLDKISDKTFVLIGPHVVKAKNLADLILINTNYDLTKIANNLNYELDLVLSPKLNYHGTLLNIYNQGVLILGESGIGKSQLALKLLERNHQLISDDVVLLTKQSNTTLIGSAPAALKYKLEIRGLGVINLQDRFNQTSFCDFKKIDLILNLVKDYRPALTELSYKHILDVSIPKLSIGLPDTSSANFIEQVIKYGKYLNYH